MWCLGWRGMLGTLHANIALRPVIFHPGAEQQTHLKQNPAPVSSAPPLGTMART